MVARSVDTQVTCVSAWLSPVLWPGIHWLVSVSCFDLVLKAEVVTERAGGWGQGVGPGDGAGGGRSERHWVRCAGRWAAVLHLPCLRPSRLLITPHSSLVCLLMYRVTAINRQPFFVINVS